MLPNTVKVAAKFSGGLFGGLILIAAIKQTKYQVFKRVIRFPSPAPAVQTHLPSRPISPGFWRRRMYCALDDVQDFKLRKIPSTANLNSKTM
jgi:hypothetical protein